MFGSDISVEVFLRDYWQKKPLLLRQAFPGIVSPVTPEELAGMACVEGINSRLLFERPEYSPEGRAWSVRYGPFDEDDFTQLPETGWSLLVSDVEKHVPAARDIIEAFRFIPDWRIDDLMISFARAGGSVGAHVDAYDVFLLQLHGTRRWMISEHFDSAHLPDTDMRILAEFIPEQSWDLEPGDMLYLPPNVAHHGIAQNDCMTGSIGFRAPALRQLVSDFGEYLARRIPEDLRYTDPGLATQSHPAELTAHTVQRLKAILLEHIDTDDATIAGWLGELSSDNRASAQLYDSGLRFDDFASLCTQLVQAGEIEHNPMSRFLFSRNDNGAVLYVDGHSHPCSVTFAETLCAHTVIDTRELLGTVKLPQDEALLLELCNKQCLLIDDGSD